jgi:hypothetical protein
LGSELLLLATGQYAAFYDNVAEILYQLFGEYVALEQLAPNMGERIDSGGQF